MFRTRLKELREAAGYRSQQTFATAFGVAQSTVGNWEAGKREPNYGTTLRLAQFFHVSVDYLLGNVNDPSFYLDNERILREINSYGDDEPEGSKKAPPVSDEAMKLAKDYDGLDRFGQKQVRDVADNEIARCEDEERFLDETTPKEEPKVITLFLEPSAAGIAAPTAGRDYEAYTLKPEDPPGAAYAVRIQGDSMEPYFPDGSIAFVNHDALRDGDIGIFCVDGGTVCKQYHAEGGVVYLFSLNRKRSDADVVLFPGGNRPFFCQGRVMTRQRFPVPGRP